MFRIFFLKKHYIHLTKFIDINYGTKSDVNFDEHVFSKMLTLLSKKNFHIDQHAFQELTRFCFNRYEFENSFKVFEFLVNNYKKNYLFNFDIIFFIFLFQDEHFILNKSKLIFFDLCLKTSETELFDYFSINENKIELFKSLSCLSKSSHLKHNRIVFNFLNNTVYYNFLSKIYTKESLTLLIKNNKIYQCKLIESF